ncbi:capsular polysaccharide synthesis protein [Sodalis sp. RH19]|uniref:capsular polysaccharide synthesis protein n=1 Tax=Sodalis sp. RH19 TaxID=3394334 RepID=UPI0039B4EE28
MRDFFFKINLKLIYIISERLKNGKCLASKKIINFLLEIKHKLIVNKLKHKFKHILSSFLSPDSKSIRHFSNEKKIWICWFQGEDAAPALVKKCIGSIRSSSRGHEVVVITDNNYADYVSIPSYIVGKYESGIISKTHFSDILRSCLLHERGGLWLDATIFCLNDLPLAFFESNFCTLKSNRPEDKVHISHGKWTGYCMSANCQYKLISFLRECFFEYWKNETKLIDYFLIDYIIKIAYLSFDDVKEDIDALPCLGDNRDLLMSLLMNEFNDEDNKKLLADDIKIYKLSYKIDCSKSISSNKTFYDFYLHL